jgi:uncharacterized protein (TIGR02588 family)
MKYIPRKNTLEWMVFAISLLLVLGVIGYLILASIRLGEGPPNLAVELGQIIPAETGKFIVPVTVYNHGDQTAVDVTVEVVLMRGEEEVETAQVTLPLVPYNSDRQGVVTFSEDPRQDRLEARVVGYLLP